MDFWAEELPFFYKNGNDEGVAIIIVAKILFGQKALGFL